MKNEIELKGLFLSREGIDCLKQIDANDVKDIICALSDYFFNGVEPDLSDVVKRVTWTAIFPATERAAMGYINQQKGRKKGGDNRHKGKEEIIH